MMNKSTAAVSRQSLRALIAGIIVWMVPFAVGTALVTPGGQPRVSFIVFKVVLVATLALTGVVAGWWLAKKGDLGSLLAIAAASLAAIAVNLVLDMVVLLPITNQAATEYLSEVAVSYLLIPVAYATAQWQASH
jgi:hypothetical protein